MLSRQNGVHRHFGFSGSLSHASPRVEIRSCHPDHNHNVLVQPGGMLRFFYSFIRVRFYLTSRKCVV